MRDILLTPQAEDDLLDIWVFIARDSPRSADRFIDTIDGKLQLLAESPNIGRQREELAPSLRSFPVGDYSIFYRTVPERIEVIRVLSSYRDIDTLFP